MELTGLNRTCADKCGGIRAISLARASDIKHIDFDPESLAFRSIAPEDAAAFARFQFSENSASLLEEAVWEDADLVVRHTLRFSIDPVDARSADAIGQIARASQAAGLVALIETNAGQTLLAGYSQRFGARYPLRLATAATDPGTEKSERQARTVTLCSTDCSFAAAAE